MVKTGLVEAIDSLAPLDEHFATFRGTDIQEKDKKKAKNKQNQARNGKDKVKSKPNQIRMAENDEEKTRFHTEEGVYCFTHMPKELKNSAVTLQGIIEKLLSDQRRRNVEVYLKEIVVKSKMEEGRFLGHMVTKEGIRADPEKVQTIIRSPTQKFKSTRRFVSYN
ncbi:hypothetical protein Tco_1301021 [Tanacetum coccineum]